MFAHPPLKTCKIRTAGLASAKSAMFGMVRNGGKRAHQGIDLASDAGYRVYAVLDGFVIDVRESASGYGKSVLLSHIADGRHYYTFYAHLSRVDVEFSQTVKSGMQLGLTGDSGNAKGMTAIANGGHLHFELRDKRSVGLGLAGRLDPLPYLKNWLV